MNKAEPFFMWYKTMLVPPPHGEWFFGRYEGLEVMPTFIKDGTCISVRVKESDIQVVAHTKALPPEWRP